MIKHSADEILDQKYRSIHELKQYTDIAGIMLFLSFSQKVLEVGRGDFVRGKARKKIKERSMAPSETLCVSFEFYLNPDSRCRRKINVIYNTHKGALNFNSEKKIFRALDWMF